MDDSSIFGGIQPPSIAHQAGDLCPSCGDPCELAGRCPSCNRLLGAISEDSVIDREAHLWRVRMAIQQARDRSFGDGLLGRARAVA